MKIYELAAIAARILAICLFLLGLRQFSSLAGHINPARTGELTVPIIYFFFSFLVPIVLAIIIWKFPITIAKAALPRIQSEEIKISDGNSFLPSAFIVLGIYILTYAIPDMVFNITSLVMLWDHVRDDFFGTNYGPSILSGVIEITIAFWLIFGCYGIQKLIASMRNRSC